MVSANAYPVMGGVETHVAQVAPRLAAAGFDVTILASDLTRSLPRRDDLNGVPLLRVPAWPQGRDYYWAPGIARTIRRQRWDLVHCQGYHTLVPPIAMLAALRQRLPYVVTFHSGGHDSAVRNRLRGAQHAVLRPLLARARRLVAVSDFEADHFAHELRLPRERFVVIPNGAAEDLAAMPDLPPVEPGLIVSLGRIERYKGHQLAVAALSDVARAMPEARLRIAGAGPYEAELRRLAAASPVAERIEIAAVPAGERRQLAELLSRAELVVLLSEYESQGIAVMEALSLRRPVLVAQTSALAGLAQRGLVRAVPLDADPATLAREMVATMRWSPPADLALPTWDECAAQLAGLYRDVLAAA
jgi:glycosyltransferase involved in cell wall biosynthesis